MNDIEIIRNPAMIAGEINLIKKQTRETVIAASVEIGRRLQEVKGMVDTESGRSGLLTTCSTASPRRTI